MDKKNISDKVEAIALIKPFLPGNMIPYDKCKCGGIVWGLKNDKGQKRALKDEYGHPIKKCGDCMINDTKELEDAQIHAYSVAQELKYKQKVD